MTCRKSAVLYASQVRRVLGRGQDVFEIIIDEISLTPSSRIAMVGPSGSGKSTLLALLGLAMRPDSARAIDLMPPDTLAIDAAKLWVAGRHDALARLRARMFGFVPQLSGLLQFLSLRANIELPQRLLGMSEPGRITQLAVALGIDTILDRLPRQVSIGQRQRAAIVRALAHAPPLVLADEPTSAAHPDQARAIMMLLVEAAACSGAALVVATHDHEIAEAAGLEIVPVQNVGPRSALLWGGS